MRKTKPLEVDDNRIREVIDLLEQENPITKKEACNKLNITYNTKRLESIITEFKERKEREAKIRKTLRSKPLDYNEKRDIVQRYLANEAITEISKSTYRSLGVIKALITEYGIPLRTRGVVEYHKSQLLDEKSLANDYEIGDLVFSARYNCLAEIVKLYKEDNTHGNIYRIWLLGSEQQYAYQPYYELADLRKVQCELNISIPHVDGVRARPLVIK